MNRSHTVVFFMLLGLTASWTVQGQVPEMMAYQGYLTDSGGTPLDGALTLTFRLHDAPEAGVIRWAETQNEVIVTEGIFSVMLGRERAFDAVPFDAPLWLSVAVGDAGAEPLAPRVALGATPYALSLRGLRIEPMALGKGPNLIGGYGGNRVEEGVIGATISGGGQNEDHHVVEGDFGTIGGGRFNTAGTGATVGGGQSNKAGDGATISGGSRNSAGTLGTVGGGDDNEAAGLFATVGGGDDNQAGGNRATIGGGLENIADGQRATVGGGGNNVAIGLGATVGGGNANAAIGNSSTVGGGQQNMTGGNGATVAGGEQNTASGGQSVIGGGKENTAEGLLATVAGGEANSASNGHATVGGGEDNTASGSFATVGGGDANEASEINATIGGGRRNLASGGNSTVGGGEQNVASGSRATIGGGQQNTVAGRRATVGGGQQNTASGEAATVPGGRDNAAAGDFSFAAGRRARIDPAHSGTFVFADGNDIDFTSLSANEFAVRARGGVRFVTGYLGDGTPVAGVRLPAGGSAWQAVSDRNAKENFQAVDARGVLQRLAEIPVETWNYKAQGVAVRHIGPMAQDFYAAFGVGEDDRHITTIDADGVALAAIQGLYQVVQAQQAQIDALQAEVERLRTNR